MMLNIKVSQSIFVDFSSWEFYILFFILPKFIFMSNFIIESCLNNNVIYFKWEETLYTEGRLSLINETTIFINNDIDIFSIWLYTHFSFIFIISGIILLISMVGALLLTTNKNLIK
jgi:NADH:ubiquinone oxidoreductase subunit 6 (subunit J)